MNKPIINKIITKDMNEQIPNDDWNYSKEPAIDRNVLPLLLGTFQPISLAEMDEVELQDRVDTKYVLTFSQLVSILPSLVYDYRILEVENHRVNHYRSLYFDSHDFYFYNAHVNGRSDRYKVRSREYTDTHLSFLEVKHKTQKDRTIKDRIVTENPIVRMDSSAENWLSSTLPMNARSLEPKIWNSFSRITLVGNNGCERVTIDLNITFSAEDKSAYLKNIVIAEVKLAARRCYSPFIEKMHQQRIHEQPFSKYCVGISMLYEQVKKNSLKSQMIKLNKMTVGASNE